MKCSKLMLAVAGLVASAAVSQAAISIAAGDIILGFSQINGTGDGVTSNTYVYNLGAASLYREYTGVPFVVDNINADLTSTFGPGWASDPTIRVGIVGVNRTGGVVSGDPDRTTYLSRVYEGPAAGSSTGFTLSAAQVGNASTAVFSFASTMNGVSENGAVDGGAVYPSASPNSFSSFLPPSSATYFGNSSDKMNVGSLGGSVTGLDVWRTLNTLTGADLTAAQSTGDAVNRTSQYIGSFELSNTGVVTFVPEPATGVLTALCGLFGILRRRRA